MPNEKSGLNRAKKQKKDEFYTQLDDIEEELSHYTHHFKDKIVYCNCDDPYESNFFKYFAANFNAFGLRKLVATSYITSPVQGTQLSLDDIAGMQSTHTHTHTHTHTRAHTGALTKPK